MIYDPNKAIDVQNARTRLEWLIDNKKLFELTQKRERRSVSQNSYLHLIFSWFAMQTGYTVDEVKQELFKRHVNREIFYDGQKPGVVEIERWRSTSSLDTKEMTVAIDRFRDFSSRDAGIYLPEPNDMALLQEIELQTQTNRYL